MLNIEATKSVLMWTCSRFQAPHTIANHHEIVISDNKYIKYWDQDFDNASPIADRIDRLPQLQYIQCPRLTAKLSLYAPNKIKRLTTNQ